jgi:hypothetical protein
VASHDNLDIINAYGGFIFGKGDVCNLEFPADFLHRLFHRKKKVNAYLALADLHRRNLQ